jgi:hypothetical protein
MAATSSLLNLIQRSSFVFSGTISSLGPSPLRVLKQLPGLAVVRFDRGFLTNPLLGNLSGRPITVQLAQGAAANASVIKKRLLFFTTAWVHGEEIAVTEIGSVPATEENEKEVARIVASLPERHLNDRIATAVLIVHGIVRQIERAKDVPRTGSEHDPYWMRAVIEVSETLKGGAPARNKAKSIRVALLFPGSADIAFRNVPKPSEGQEAVFLLHAGVGKFLPQGAYIAPDPADIQPPRQLRTVRRLLRLTR